MKNYSRGIAKGKMLIFGVLAGTVFTFAIMFLWNWLMPAIFGLTVITFWQALGILVLSKILFGRGQRPTWQEREKSRMHKEQFMSKFSRFRTQKEEKPEEKTNYEKE